MVDFFAKTPRDVLKDGSHPSCLSVPKSSSGLKQTFVFGFSDKPEYDTFRKASSLDLTLCPRVKVDMQDQRASDVVKRLSHADLRRCNCNEVQRMKWNQVKQQWPSVELAVKRTWVRIDEADLTMIHGERDSFTRILAQRYGCVQADAQQKVDAFVERLSPESKMQMRLNWFSRLMQKCWGSVCISSCRDH